MAKKRYCDKCGDEIHGTYWSHVLHEIGRGRKSEMCCENLCPDCAKKVVINRNPL